MLTQIDHERAIREIRLDRPPVNAINPELVSSLKSAIHQAFAQGQRAIVLSGKPGLFSAGLDVPELLALDEERMLGFWHDFMQLLACIARSPIPIAAAITGHCPAGGTVLGVFCDYRVMASGDFRIGLNETQVGLFVPEVVQYAFKRLVGAYRGERLMLAGELVNAEIARDIGLVDELVPAEETIAKAVSWCANMLTLPAEAFAHTRRIARADLHATFDQGQELATEAFIHHWFRDETRAGLQQLVARLKSKKSS